VGGIPPMNCNLDTRQVQWLASRPGHFTPRKMRNEHAPMGLRASVYGLVFLPGFEPQSEIDITHLVRRYSPLGLHDAPKPHTPWEKFHLGRLSRTSLQVWPHTCSVQGKLLMVRKRHCGQKTKKTVPSWDWALHSPLF
jgi:hypothetical protein